MVIMYVFSCYFECWKIYFIVKWMDIFMIFNADNIKKVYCYVLFYQEVLQRRAYSPNACVIYMIICIG